MLCSAWCKFPAHSPSEPNCFAMPVQAVYHPCWHSSNAFKALKAGQQSLPQLLDGCASRPHSFSSAHPLHIKRLLLYGPMLAFGQSGSF
eukprot:817586-Rhodomonas_salina.1